MVDDRPLKVAPGSPQEPSELYLKLVRLAFAESGRHENKTAAPRLCAVVLLNPVLVMTFASKAVKTGSVFGAIALFVAFFLVSREDVFGGVAFWVLVLAGAPFMLAGIAELLLVRHLKTPSGGHLFSCLYRWRWIGVACHPGIGDTLYGPADHEVRRCLHIPDVRWLTPVSFLTLKDCFSASGYPEPKLLLYPCDWGAYESTLQQLREEIARLPAEVIKREKENSEWAKFSHDPFYRMYCDKAKRSIESVGANLKLYIASCMGQGATYALPTGFTVCRRRLKSAELCRSNFTQV